MSRATIGALCRVLDDCGGDFMGDVMNRRSANSPKSPLTHPETTNSPNR